MKNKVGLLTFHKSINYGSVLQAWALANVISKQFDVEVIDYQPKEYDFLYGLYRPWNSFINIKYNLKRVPLKKDLINQTKLFGEFRKKYLPLSKKKYSFGNDSEIKDIYTTIVVGSDQVWNLRAKDCDQIYFLPFSFKGKKISYACSINDTDYTENRCSADLIEQICDFDLISIREESGKNKLEDYITHRKKVWSLLDPTLLCEKKDYEKLLSERIIKHNYIFLYNVWTSDAGIEAAKYISKKLQMPVYTIMTASNIKDVYKLHTNGVIVEKVKTSPTDFLNFIKYASYVVTESFHGTAFSLIFERPFICVSNRTNDERLNSILELINLKERYIQIKQLYNFNFTQKIDYNSVKKERLKKADECIEILYGAIKGEIKS